MTLSIKNPFLFLSEETLKICWRWAALPFADQTFRFRTQKPCLDYMQTIPQRNASLVCSHLQKKQWIWPVCISWVWSIGGTQQSRLVGFATSNVHLLPKRWKKLNRDKKVVSRKQWIHSMKAPERRRTQNKTIFSRILPPGPVLICICILKLIPFNLFLICGDARSCLVKKYETIIKCTDNSSSEDNYRVMITRVESVWFTEEYTSNMKKIAVKPGLNVLFL